MSFFFFFFLLCRWNSFCCHCRCCLFRHYLFYEKCCGCQNSTLAICMGHISFANSTLLINTRLRISNTGNSNQQILHEKKDNEPYSINPSTSFLIYSTFFMKLCSPDMNLLHSMKFTRSLNKLLQFKYLCH